MDMVYAVHGVGPNEKGEVEQAVRACLSEHKIDGQVKEFNWSEVSQAPGPGERVELSILSEAIKTMNNAAFAECRHAGGENLYKFSTLLTEIGRTLFFSAFLSITWFAFVLWGILAPIDPRLESFSVWFSAYWNLAKCLGGLGLAMLVVSLLYDLIHAIINGQYRLFLISIRRNGLIFLSPFVALVGLPFVVKWSDAKMSVIKIVGMQAVSVVTVFSSIALIEYFIHTPGQEYLTLSDVGKFAGVVTLMGVAVTVVVVTLASLTVAIVPFATKVMLDVLRYVGNHTYRKVLLDKLDEHFCEATARFGKGDCVYLLGHSLGSVIVLDYLLNRLTLPIPYRIVFITGGSPIRRYFSNFFPQLAFAQSPDESAEVLTRCFHRFQWINIYRPADPIGTSLGFETSKSACDIDSKQRHSFLKAHFNYWSDNQLLRLVLEKLESASDNKILDEATNEADRPTLATADRYLPVRDYISPFARIVGKLCPPVMAGVVLLLAIWLGVMGTWRTIISIHNQQLHLSTLKKAGIATTVDVVHHRVIISMGEGRSPPQFDDYFEFTFDDGGDTPRSVQRVVSNDAMTLSTSSAYIDFSELRDHIRASTNRVEVGRPLQPDITLKKRAEGLRIVYLPTDPNIFYLPAFETRLGGLRYLSNWLLEVLISLLGLPLVYAFLFGIVSIIVYHIWDMFSGGIASWGE